MKVFSTRGFAVLLAAVAATLVLLLWPEREERPEELIERKVVLITRAAEEKDLSAIMEHVSERFRMPEGGKQEVKQLLAAQLFRGSWVRVFTADLQLKVTSPSRAEISGRFIFARSEAQRLADLAKESVVSSYAIDASLEKEADGEWRFLSARYREAEPF